MWSLGRALDAYHEALIIHGRNYSSQEQLNWIQNLITRCFDVSQIAPEFQQSTATDAGVFLRELLIRVPLPSWETLPDAKEIAEMPEDQRPTSYRFGEVPVHLVKLDTGDRAGEWVLSKGTLKGAEAAYQRVKHLDPIAGDGDLYRLHFFQPGWLIPTSWIANLPAWTGYNILGQALWQWGAGCLALFIVAVILLVGFVIMRRCQQRPITIAGRVAHLIFFLLVSGCAVALDHFMQHHVFISGDVLVVFTVMCSAIMLIAFVLAILTLGVLIAEIIIASPRINPHGLDAALIRVIARTISILFLREEACTGKL